MNFIELACVALFLARSKRNKTYQRRYWVHPIVSQRLLKGQFHKIYLDLRNHPQKFFNYFRMSVVSFDELLRIVGSKITFQKTNMRSPVGPEQRLAVTIRYKNYKPF